LKRLQALEQGKAVSWLFRADKHYQTRLLCLYDKATAGHYCTHLQMHLSLRKRLFLESKVSSFAAKPYRHQF